MTTYHQRNLVRLMEEEMLRLMRRSRRTGSMAQRIHLHSQTYGYMQAVNVVQKHAGTGRVWNMRRVLMAALQLPPEGDAEPSASLPKAA